MRKLKRGTRNFKAKIPLNCFNCGKIGHFDSKCLYAKCSKSDEEEETPKKKKKIRKDIKEIF